MSTKELEREELITGEGRGEKNKTNKIKTKKNIIFNYLWFSLSVSF